MLTAGLSVQIDAVGNVVGRYPARDPDARTLIVGSHYDTVVNAGRYDGRLGILTGLVVLERLNELGLRLPFNVELIGFSEEEGVRFATPYIGSRAVAGRFDHALLERTDAGGVRLVDLLSRCGMDPRAIAALARPGKTLRGYLEVHIEQGPVLLKRNIPVGIVSAIAGGVRQTVTLTGVHSHAGSTPMDARHDALAAAAEVILYVEHRCQNVAGLVGTVGRIEVADSAINVIPGACTLSLDIRAGDDPTRDAAIADIHGEIKRICARRRLAVQTNEIARLPAVPCAPGLKTALADAITRAGLPVVELPSGAGHDAVMFEGVTEVGMMFVRCGNGGISHSPLEAVSADDADAAARILLDVLVNLN